MANGNVPNKPPTNTIEPPTPDTKVPAPPRGERKATRVNMGGLPQWKTILRDDKFRNADDGKQNLYREKWLKTIIDLNPEMGKDEQRYMRKKVYQADPGDYSPGPWNKTEAEKLVGAAMRIGKRPFEKSAKDYKSAVEDKGAILGAGPIGMIPELARQVLPEAKKETEEAAKKDIGKGFETIEQPPTFLPSNIEGGGQVVRKVVGSEVIGETGLEKSIKKFAKNVGKNFGKALGMSVAMSPVVGPLSKVVDKEALIETINDVAEVTGRAGKVAAKVREKQLKDIVLRGWKVLDQSFGLSDFVFGGVLGGLEKEKKKADIEGRSKYYRELPVDSRLREIGEVIKNPNKFTGMDLNAARFVKEQLREGYSLEEIDQQLFEKIKNKELPEVKFYYGIGKDIDPKEALNPIQLIGMGLLGTPGFDLDSAWDAFWKGIVADDKQREHIFPGEIHKELTGQSLVDRYGWLKGNLADLGLMAAGDPILVTDLLGYKTVKGLLGKARGSKFASKYGENVLDNLTAFMSGEMELKDMVGFFKAMRDKHGLEMIPNLADDAQTRRILETAERFTQEENFQRTVKMMDEAWKNMQKKPPPEGMKRLVDRTQGAPEVLAKIEEKYNPEPIIADVEKSLRLDNSGVVKSLDDLPKTKELTKQPGMIGTGVEHGEIIEPAHRAVSGYIPRIIEKPGTRELPPTRILSPAEDTIERAAQSGPLKVGKEGITEIGDTTEELILRREKELKEMGLEDKSERIVQDLFNSVSEGTRREGVEQILSEVEQGKRILSYQEEVERAGKYLHDKDTRRALIKKIQNYESVLDNPASPPTAVTRAYESVEEAWKKAHPDQLIDNAWDVSPLHKVLSERQAIKAGHEPAERTGSDLLLDMGEEWTSRWADLGTPASRAEESRNITEGLKRLVDDGKSIKKMATYVDEKDVILRESYRRDILNQLNKHGISVSGGSDVGDTMASIKTKKGTPGIEGRVEALYLDYKDLLKNKRLSKAEREKYNTVLKKLKSIYKKYVKEHKSIGRGEIKRTDVEKEIQKLEDIYNKVSRRKRTTFAVRKKEAPGVTVIYSRRGKAWKKTKVHTENPGREYLGSIFGMAQKFFDDRAARRLARRTAQEELNELNQHLKKSFVSIEKQFEEFPIVGRAIKNIYSVKDAVQERGLQLIKEFSGQTKLKRWSSLKKSDIHDIPLIYEDRKKWDALTREEQVRLKPYMDKLSNFYEEFRVGYKNRGVDVNFKEHFRNRLIETNKAIKNAVDQIKSGTRQYVGNRELASMGIHNLPADFNPRNSKQVRGILSEAFFNNEKMMSELKNFEYMHIPHGMWFESGFDSAAFIKAMKLANAQGRKTFRIADLLETGAIRDDQVNVIDIMSSYIYRASKDFPLLDVKNAMKKSNLVLDFDDIKHLGGQKAKDIIADRTASGWKRVDPRFFPMFGRSYMHPAMEEWLHHFKYERLNANKFDKLMGMVKVAQFAKPLFLPYYDLMQGAVARGPLGMLNVPKQFMDYMWAARMMRKRPKLYWELMHAGLQSKPMALPFNQWVGQMNALKTTNAGSYLWSKTKEAGVTAGLKPIYEASWNVAWGLDKMVRLGTARRMMKEGMSTFDAAQFAALVHSDYANVPVKTRRALNRALFTGTFKITMFRFYKEMLKNLVKVPYKKAIGRGAELSMQEKQLAKAGAGTILGAMVGLDTFMQSKGYKRDQFARRYYKDVRTKDGKWKEDVMVFSSPLTMIPKYGYKIRDLFTENYADSKIEQALQSFKWDIHPVYRITYDLSRNKDDAGDPIWMPFADSEPLKYAKMADYAVTQAIAIIKEIGLKDEPDDQQEAWELYKKDMGQVFSLISAPTTFNYLRDPKIIRYKKKLDRTKLEWKRAMKDAIRDGRFTKEMAVNGHKKLQKQTRELIEAIKKTESIHDNAVMQGWKKEDR